MPNIGWAEMAVIVVVLLLVVGPKELPRMARSFSKYMRQARKLTSEFQDALEAAVYDDEVKAVARELKESSAQLTGALDETGNIGGAGGAGGAAPSIGGGSGAGGSGAGGPGAHNPARLVLTGPRPAGAAPMPPPEPSASASAPASASVSPSKPPAPSAPAPAAPAPAPSAPPLKEPVS